MKQRLTSHEVNMFFDIMAEGLAWPDLVTLLQEKLEVLRHAQVYIEYDYDGEDYYLLLCDPLIPEIALTIVCMNYTNIRKFNYFVKLLKIPF